MEFESDKSELNHALQVAARAINPRSPLPILNHVLLDVTCDRLRVVATDLDLGVTVNIPVSSIDSGSVAVPARLLADIVAKLAPAPVKLIASVDGRLTLQSGRSKFQIATLPAVEFPGVPVASECWFSVSQKAFKTSLNRLLFACAHSDESRAVMTGVFAEIKGDTLTLVSTDGRRMALQELELANPKRHQLSAVIPAVTLKEVQRLLSDCDELLEFDLTANHFSCVIGEVSMHSRLLEGVFPDYKRVVPSRFQRYVRVGREALKKSIERLLIVSQDPSSPNLLVMDIGEDTIAISANTADLGSGQEDIAAAIEGEPLQIAFNGKYLLQALNALDCEEVQFDLQGDETSGILHPHDQSDYKYVVMPIRLRQAEEVSNGEK